MQLVRLRRKLADIESILSKYSDDGEVVIMGDEIDALVKSINEAIEAADKIALGHQALAEVLNKI